MESTTVTCRDCERVIDTTTETAYQPYAYDRDTRVCEDCWATRENARLAREGREERQGQVLLDLLPAMRKVGRVVSMTAGLRQWTSEARIEKGGKTYIVHVDEVTD